MKFSDHMKNIIATDRSPVGIIINDKIRVKEYVDERLGENSLFDHRIHAGYSIQETIEACNRRPCVVRLNNGWHKMRFLFDDHDKISPDQLHTWQSAPHPSAEWAYKQTRPGFTVEKLLPKKHRLLKFFMFHGKVRYIWEQRYSVETKKIDLLSSTMHDREWNQIEVQWNKAKIIECRRPEKLIEMISMCEKLWCDDWKFMRIDLYYLDNGEIRLSEANNYHAGGTNGFSGDFDEILGIEMENE